MTTATYLNTYKPPVKNVAENAHLHTPPEEYDFNFCFEVKPLKSDRVELRPFVPSLYSQRFFDAFSKCDPNIAKWITHYNTLEDFTYWSESIIRTNPGNMTYAIFTQPLDKQDPVDPEEYELAGMISMTNCDVDMMAAEIGWIILFDQYQRTHVLSNAAGLVMHRILDMPSEGGIGLRRCQWVTTSLHTKSQAAAKRLGFNHEGILRAHRVLAKGRQGLRPGRKGDYREDCMTRDTWSASVSWDQWEESVRDHVDKLMARR